MGTDASASPSAFARLITGQTFGLAQTYWTFYLIWAAMFFVAGSVLVAERDWVPYVGLLGLTVAWSFVLLTLVKRYYVGSDPGKALGRIGMLFLLLNLTNALATFSFI